MLATYVAIGETAGGVGYTAGGCAESSAAAEGSEKRRAARAFCTETSVPKTGASGVRTRPTTTPFVSTTLIVTCAVEPSGRRICARVRLATLIASSRRRDTSGCVIMPSVPAIGG
jgi:hypothetical protein